MNRRGFRCTVVSVARNFRSRFWFVAGTTLFLAATISVNAQNESSNDEGYTKKIREYTTEPFFLTNLSIIFPLLRRFRHRRRSSDTSSGLPTFSPIRRTFTVTTTSWPRFLRALEFSALANLKKLVTSCSSR